MLLVSGDFVSSGVWESVCLVVFISSEVSEK
jgi:hypothetical protein